MEILKISIPIPIYFFKRDKQKEKQARSCCLIRVSLAGTHSSSINEAQVQPPPSPPFFLPPLSLYLFIYIFLGYVVVIK